MKPDIGRESRCLPTPPAFKAPVWGPRRNIVITYGMENLEWRGYPTAKKTLKTCLPVSAEYTNVTDRRTDGQTDGHTDGRTPHDGIGPAYA